MEQTSTVTIHLALKMELLVKITRINWLKLLVISLIRESVSGILKLLLQVTQINRPFARFGHMVRNKLLQWAFQSKGNSGWTGTMISFVFEFPLCNLRPRIIYFVPCDRILQKTYCVQIFSSFSIVRAYVAQRGRRCCERFNFPHERLTYINVSLRKQFLTNLSAVGIKS